MYQRYINFFFFEYLDNFYIVYLDNIFIYSKNLIKYEIYIYKIFQKLKEIGLQADIKKYKFGVTKTKYLGFIINTKRIKINLEKIEVIKN
jgi:hypothetical protein